MQYSLSHHRYILAVENWISPLKYKLTAKLKALVGFKNSKALSAVGN